MPAGKAQPAKTTNKEFVEIFARLKALVKPYEGQLAVVKETPTEYYLQTHDACYRGKPVWFGGVRMGKAYVSYHLIPVYASPALAKKVSPSLKKRMQGKSCFNFTAVDEGLFGELEKLTREGFTAFQKMKEKGFAVT
jgi:hypothetical protein